MKFQQLQTKVLEVNKHRLETFSPPQTKIAERERAKYRAKDLIRDSKK